MKKSNIKNSDWQTQLIAIYVLISTLVNSDELDHLRMRMSNNRTPVFSDEEILTIYFHGLVSGRDTLTKIYKHARDHLSEWFPTLVSYQTFTDRLNFLGDPTVGICGALTDSLLRESDEPDLVRLLDSMPIIMAKEKRRWSAKVAPEMANCGYCATKREHYYGVKLHVVGRKIEGTLPIPEFIGLTCASMNDLKGGEAIAPRLEGGFLFDDRAYFFAPMMNAVLEENGTMHFAVKKRKRGEAFLEIYDDVRNTDISIRRQPIESLFSWFCEKVGLQNGSKIRSSAGLMIHVFGRVAAAMILMQPMI